MKSLPAYAVAVIAMAITPPNPAEAQQSSATRSGNDEVRQVVVYGRDPCPRGSGGEIVICARRPESERYRLPRAARGRAPGPASTSWAARARSLEYVGRTGTQSCSTVGPGGHTGCWEQMMRAAREEQDAADRGE